VWLVRAADHAPVNGPREQAMLDAGERARYGAFVRDSDRDMYGAAHVALRRLLGGYLGRAPGAVVIGREDCPVCGGPHGRPAVVGSDGLHFSLSHSAGLVLLAFAARPVGVDIEEIPRPEIVDELGDVIMHPAERAELAGLTPQERAVAFGRCWARKEAYLKGTGAGLGDNPHRSRVGAGPEPYPVPGWRIEDLDVGGYAAGFSAALAVVS
jgi:4'-phosphopantetheinyl transferase